MAKAKAAEVSADESVVKVYELGSQIVSSIPEEQVAKEYEGLKDLITKAGGTIISEEAPKLMDLAYTMVKHVHGKNFRHTTAHFSWIKFEIDPVKATVLHEAVSKNENVLRFILIKTDKENTMYGHKFAHEVKDEKNGRDGGKEKREYRKDKVETPELKEVTPASAAEVDQAIEDIVK